MVEKKIRKVITTKISIKSFNEQILDIDSLPENERDANLINAVKNKFGIDIGNILVSVNEKDVIIKWYTPKMDKKAEFFHKKAIEYARKKEYQKAIASWQDAININSTDPDYFFNMGIVCLELKKLDEASQHLRETLKICPIYYKAGLILGSIFYKQRKFELAEKYIRGSLLFNPRNGLASLTLGTIYCILRDYDKGITMYEKTLELMPKDPRPYMGLAKIYSLKGKTEKANKCFHQIIELDKSGRGKLAQYAKRAIVTESELKQKAVETTYVTSDKSAEEFYSEGYTSYIAGNYLKAEALYRKYLTIKPDDDYVWCALGETQLRAGKCEQAIAAFQKAISLEPKGLYYKELAIAYDLAGNPAEVRIAVEKAINHNKKDSIVYAIGGKNLLAEATQTEAIEMLEEAVKLNKNNFLARYYLAIGLSRIGEIERAIEQLEEIKATKIKTPLKDKADELLSELLSGSFE